MAKTARRLVLAIVAFAALPLAAQAQPSAVPTLGEMGLIALAGGLVTAGTFVIRRRRR